MSLSQYSNYDSREIIYGTIRGGLNGYQEFRAQPQQIIKGAGLLVSLISDTSGILFIEYSNIIQEPYNFSTQYNITGSNQIYTFEEAIHSQYFRIRFINNTPKKQETFILTTYILDQNPLVTIDAHSSFNLDISGNLIVNIKD